MEINENIRTRYNLAFNHLQRERFDEAFAEFSNLHNEGFYIANIQLAYMYKKGIGTNLNFDKALDLYKEAITKCNHYPEALENAKINYAFLLLKLKNFLEAKKIFEELAHEQNSLANLKLYEIHQYGLGVIKDKKLSKKYLDEALKSKDIFTISKLAKIHLRGEQGIFGLLKGLTLLIRVFRQLSAKLKEDPKLEQRITLESRIKTKNNFDKKLLM